MGKIYFLWIRRCFIVTGIVSGSLLMPMSLNKKSGELSVVHTFASAEEIKGSVEQGRARSVTCAACHGPDGNSANPLYPSIAGLEIGKFTKSLRGFRDGDYDREKYPNAAMMVPFAQNLSDEDIANLAAYFNAQTPK